MSYYIGVIGNQRYLSTDEDGQNALERLMTKALLQQEKWQDADFDERTYLVTSGEKTTVNKCAWDRAGEIGAGVVPLLPSSAKRIPEHPAVCDSRTVIGDEKYAEYFARCCDVLLVVGEPSGIESAILAHARRRLLTTYRSSSAISPTLF